MVTKSEQKERTRRALMDAALKQLSATRSFGSLSLREVAREAGIAPTSFYRHFHELEDLGLALVDEAGLTLRQMLRNARNRIKDSKKGGVIQASVETFMEYLDKNPQSFLLLMREKDGGSERYRAAIQAEIDHIISELKHDLLLTSKAENKKIYRPDLLAQSLVVIAFNLGGEALELSGAKKKELALDIMIQLRMAILGAQQLSKKKTKNLH